MRVKLVVATVLVAVLGSGAAVALAATHAAPAAHARPAAQASPAAHAGQATHAAPKALQAHPAAAPRPVIRWDPIPFGPTRRAQTTAYVRRHYGSFIKRPSWRLVHPHVIVIHYTDASYHSTFNTFANDVPDSELHELPATSAHFVIGTDGTIHQLVSLGTIARHTVGLNWTAIGIEHVGYSDAQVLGDRSQMAASLKLVHWLACRYHIQVRNVIGHNESLSSPYHHEDVAALRTQTHSDFDRRDMNTYRSRLRRLGGC